MYEDKTTENILEDMLDNFGADVRTDEGSLAYNSCAKIASALSDAYYEMGNIRNNLSYDTMDLDHLIQAESQTGVKYNEATAAIARGVFQQEIPEGTQFYCGDYTYTSGEAIPDTTNQYYMICDEEGTAPNTNTGELTPVDYIEDYLGGSITAVLTPGTDDEDVEDYRARVLASVGIKSFGGNRKDYQDFIDSLDDVGACKPKRRASDSPYINIWILDSNHNVPTSTIVSDVQEAVDPEENSGEGEGMAPCCHHVKVYAASSVTVNVSATLTLDDGYTILSVKDSVEAAIAAYLYGLRVAWESEGLDSMYVRIAQIEARILSVTGVLDVADVLINSDDENIELSFEKVPVMGEVTLSV